MPVEEIQRTVYLDYDGNDILRTTFTVEKGHGKPQLRKFTFNYTTTVNGNEATVVRYDCSHGYVHVHRYYRNLDAQPEKLALDCSFETMAKLAREIDEKWMTWKRTYLSKLHN